MSIELLLVIGLWAFAFTLAGISLFWEIRARQLRERLSRIVRPTEEEEQLLAEVEDEELRMSLPARLFRTFLLPIVQRFSQLMPQASGSLKITDEILAMAGYPWGLTAEDLMGLVAYPRGSVLGRLRSLVSRTFRARGSESH